MKDRRKQIEYGRCPVCDREIQVIDGKIRTHVVRVDRAGHVCEGTGKPPKTDNT